MSSRFILGDTHQCGNTRIRAFRFQMRDRLPSFFSSAATLFSEIPALQDRSSDPADFLVDPSPVRPFVPRQRARPRENRRQLFFDLDLPHHSDVSMSQLCVCYRHFAVEHVMPRDELLSEPHHSADVMTVECAAQGFRRGGSPGAFLSASSSVLPRSGRRAGSKSPPHACSAQGFRFG